MNQRWNRKRHTFRPEEPIRTDRYEVVEIPDDTTARKFIETHHYSGSYPAARRRYGLMELAPTTDVLVGVSVFSVPVQAKVLTNYFECAKSSVELGRFVLLDDVPGNGETWFLAQCFRLLKRDGFKGVVSFSDPVPRTTADGNTIFAGHLGTIYQAHNAVLDGRSKPQTLALLPDGTVFNERCKSKIRKLEQGWQYSADKLKAWGADDVWLDAPSRWLNHWLWKVCRPLRHPGNYRYLWGLDRNTRRNLPPTDNYPKRRIA